MPALPDRRVASWSRGGEGSAGQGDVGKGGGAARDGAARRRGGDLILRRRPLGTRSSAHPGEPLDAVERSLTHDVTATRRSSSTSIRGGKRPSDGQPSESPASFVNSPRRRCPAATVVGTAAGGAHPSTRPPRRGPEIAEALFSPAGRANGRVSQARRETR